MDRCRCEDYAEAVKNLKIFTPGTLRPDILEKFDRSRFTVWWKKHGVDYDNMNFTVPKALYIAPKVSEPPTEQQKIETMWCPYMTPVIVKTTPVE